MGQQVYADFRLTGYPAIKLAPIMSLIFRRASYSAAPLVLSSVGNPRRGDFKIGHITALGELMGSLKVHRLFPP